MTIDNYMALLNKAETHQMIIFTVVNGLKWLSV